MKKLYLLLVFLFSFGTVFAQQELSKEEQERRERNIQAGNPFAKFGYKAKVATLSKGKYLEVHDLDSIVTIGSVRYHVDNKKIVGFIPKDTTGNMYARPTMDTPSRWLSPDPLMEEFPDWSPYNYVMNNPLRYVDPDGLSPIDVLGDPPGKVIAVFYHGGATGGGKETTVGNAGYTGQIFTNSQLSATNSGREFTGTIIAPGLTSASGVNTGLDFINQNYETGDQVIIYGYSYGVDVAVDLSHNLNEMGINIDLLVTVDGSDGPLQNLTVNTSIPENVGTNLNIYQTSNSGASSSSRSTGSSSGATSSSSGSNSSGSSNRSNSGSSNSPGSRGSANKAVNSNTTNVINKNVTGSGVNHGNIQQKAEGIIQPLINTRIHNN